MVTNEQIQIIRAEKKKWRRRMIEARELMADEEREEKSERISERLWQWLSENKARKVSCYLAFGYEVDLWELVKKMLAEGMEVAIPKMEKGEMKMVRVNNLERMKRNKMGIWEPAGGEIVIEFDACLTPGLAYSNKGDRLGYGGGNYDRFFGRYEVKNKIGVGYGLQVVERLPVGESDVKVDMVVTEERVMRGG